MSEDILQVGARQAGEIRNINRDLTEKALRMRCLGYLAQAKAKLLTQTILEVDSSKKNLKKTTLELQQQRDLGLNQQQTLEAKIAEIDHLNTELRGKNAELEEKNRELERLNRLFVDREFRIKELRDRVAQLEAGTRSRV